MFLSIGVSSFTSFSRQARPSEVEANLSCYRARSDVMRAAERGEKVIQGILIRKVDYGYSRAPLEAIPVEKIVLTDREIEQMSRLNARRIGIVVFSVWRGHFDQRGTKRRSRAVVRQRHCRRGVCTAAGEAGLKLLIGGHRNATGICN